MSQAALDVHAQVDTGFKWKKKLSLKNIDKLQWYHLIDFSTIWIRPEPSFLPLGYQAVVKDVWILMSARRTLLAPVKECIVTTLEEGELDNRKNFQSQGPEFLYIVIIFLQSAFLLLFHTLLSLFLYYRLLDN